MLKQSIGIAMLCIAGQAYSADIIVTTTEDSLKDDKECSLREAIEYINQGMPEEGYFGCGGKEATANILLEKKAVYKLQKQIKISAGLTLKTTYENNINDEVALGANNATIQMAGTDRIFYIDDAKKDLSTINLKEINLQGCAKDKCSEQGGLIYNNEYLVLEYSHLYGGAAVQGGAIYNVGEPLEEGGASSLVEIEYSLIEDNQAQEGAILYSRVPQFRIVNSVFRGNKTTQTNSANIYSAKALEESKQVDFPGMPNRVFSSTFLKNEGPIINVLDGIGLNNLTIVGNSAGIRFNAPLGKAYLANSIILGNPYPLSQRSANCEMQAGDKSILQNNLVTQECGTGDANYPNEFWTGTALIAGENLEGTCKTLSQDQSSLLCPYAQPKDKFLGYFRPRILMSYNSLADSLIVNKGKLPFSSTAKLVGCQASDQRDQARESDNSFCDRGAIELVVPTSTGLIGEDLIIGNIAKASVADLLGDSDLLPKEQCEALFGKNPTGEAWQAGCLRVVPTVTQPKGMVRIDEEGNLTYTPEGNWHGTAEFEIQLVTTTTRFNQHSSYLKIKIRMVQAPENHMESDKLKTSGGALGIVSLLSLLGLAGLRRYKK